MKKRLNLSKMESNLELMDMRNKNATSNSLINSQIINSSIEMSKDTSYKNHVKKLALSSKKDSSANDESTEKAEIPLFIQKAIKHKQEREKEQNTSLMNELASKLGFLKKTLKSKDSLSDIEDEPKERNVKKRSSVLEKQSTLEIKNKKEILERVFWTKEKMEQIRNQLKTARDKINEKTINDFNELYELIDSHSNAAIMYMVSNLVIGYLIPFLNNFTLRSLRVIIFWSKY
jgi:hypothetical protein